MAKTFVLWYKRLPRVNFKFVTENALIELGAAKVINSYRVSGALVAILVVAFLGPFGSNMILPMFKPLKISYNVDVLMIGLGITVYMIPFSILQLFSGIISDIIRSRRKPIVIGMMLYGIGALGVATSPNIYLFLAFRVLQGTGNAIAMPISMALVGDVFSENVRGRIMGLASIATTLGTTLGPLFGGYISSINWRFGFILLTFLALCFALLLQLILSEKRVLYRQRPRSILLILSKSFLDRKVLILSFLGFIIFFVYIGLFTYLSDTLSLPPYEYEEKDIAQYLSIAGVGGLLAGVVAGTLTDLIGRKQIALMGFIMLLPILTIYITNYWINWLVILLFFQGFSVTTAFTAINTMIVEINPSYRATVTSIYGSLRFLGYALGPALLHSVYRFSLLSGVALTCALLILVGMFMGLIVLIKK